MTLKATRRQFLQTSAAAGVSSLAAPAILRARNVNDKLNVACIGVGGRGGSHLPALATENVVAICNFEYSGWLTEANHLGNVAYRTGKKLEWNAATMSCPNAPEAARFIRREYRSGWSL